MLKQAKENKPSLSHLISHLKVNNKEKKSQGKTEEQNTSFMGGGKNHNYILENAAMYSVLRGRGIAATVCTS